MKSLGHILVCLAFLCLSANVVLALDENKDLVNLGPDAHDLTVVLEGNEQITETYDGYSDGEFDSVNVGDDGSGNTTIEWDNFHDGDDNVINSNDTIHVGWSTEDSDCEVKDMYWTDENGDRIEGSKVDNVTANPVLPPQEEQEIGSGYSSVEWNNVFNPGQGSQEAISIDNVHYAIWDGGLPLTELNARNTALAAVLQPLDNGSFVVNPGQTIVRPLPVSIIPSNSTLILRYEVSAPGSAAEVMDFVQIGPGHGVPSLTTWGLLVLAILVLVSGVWVAYRRRRTARLRA